MLLVFHFPGIPAVPWPDRTGEVMLVDTSSRQIVTLPRHLTVQAMWECNTSGCTNQGPLGVPVAAEEYYASRDEARSDARCRPCVEAITFLLEEVASGGVDLRGVVMDLTVVELRGGRVSAPRA